jgi:hypothetical protein
MALILPESVERIIPLAAGGRKRAAIIEPFSSLNPDRDQKSMIHSLGDRKVITRGDHWVADNATVIGSVLHADPGFPLTLGRNASVDQKREIELETN